MTVPLELDVPLLLPYGSMDADGRITAASGVQNVGALTASLQGMPVNDIQLQLIAVELEPGDLEGPTIGEMFQRVDVVLSRDGILSDDDLLVGQLNDLSDTDEELTLTMWAPLSDPFNLMIAAYPREAPKQDLTVFARLQLLCVVDTEEDGSAGFELLSATP